MKPKRVVVVLYDRDALEKENFFKRKIVNEIRRTAENCRSSNKFQFVE